jgi:hypothetical protein
MAGGELFRELACATSAAPGAAHTLAAMLGDQDRDHWELFDLMARRLAHRHPVALAEHVAAVAARRPVINEFIHSPRGKQRPPMTLMPRLPSGLAPRPVLPSPRGAPGRFSARWPRGVPRVLGQLTLELLNPRLKLLNTAIHLQQHLDYSLTPRVIDRFRLNALHATKFDGTQLCPPNQLNAYRFW